MKERYRIGLLLVLALAVYANALRDGFTMDDSAYVLNNPQVTHTTLKGLFQPNKITNVFRPATFATLAINWKVGPSRPLGYHLVNLLLHAAVTLLLYLLLVRLLGPVPQARAISLAAASLFAVHPIHTEAVTSIVGRSELLAAGFILLAWILHLADLDIPALFCFALALLSKESAVIFLPLVIIGDYARGQWKPVRRYGGITGMALIYLGVLWKVQGGRFGQAKISVLDNPLANLSAGWRVLNAIRVAWKYVALQVYPAKLSCDYSFNQIPVYLDWRHVLPAALGAAAVLAAWGWAAHKRRSTLFLAGGIYLASFAVTSNILMPTGTIMGERLAYLPSAGFCLLVAIGWNALKNRQRTLALGLFALVVAALSIRTVVRNVDWENNLNLFSAGVNASPGSAKMHAYLASEYLNYGRLDSAQQEVQTALRIFPDFPGALATYGLVENARGHYEMAGSLLEKAVNMSGRDDPNYDFMDVSMAIMLIRTGRDADAMDVLNGEIQQSPEYARAWANRAVLHLKKGDTTSARSDAEVAVRLDPSNAEAQGLLRALNGRSVSPAASAR